MNFRKWIGLAVLLAALVIGERIYLYRPDHKYRLTVEVETPGGIRSASGVFSVHPNRAYGGSGSGPAGPRAKGDAVFVDLGNGRNLAMLLLHGINPAETDGMSYLPMRAFAAAGRRIDFRDVKRQTDSVPVAGELIPTLVTFADVANPASARAVDPANLPAAFGQGFRLRNISLQIVPSGLWPLDFGGVLGEPVTRQIQTQLPWSNDPAKAAAALSAAGIVAVPPADAGFIPVQAFRRE
ncbi:hypothetical protein HNQ36_001390 [Afipia massiliensis]|uniref:Uncharacterized protein n=1 Tax=Afipia massiliensis TaxID=211460 RepID=A0A840N3W5_9BRAD|nr:hypothetical protein [Afipia massiliensis]MBB5051436.1 hypothetical protein [Afipia massiliensis]